MAKSKTITEPRSTDILCGRVKNTFNHEGNQIFRLVVESHLDGYKRATSRVERSNLFKVVLRELQKTGCRFLRYDEPTQEWEELDMKATRNKISHAFRDRYPPFNFNRTAKFRRKQYEMEEQQGGENDSSDQRKYRQTSTVPLSSQNNCSSTATPSTVYSSRPPSKKTTSSRQEGGPGNALCDMLSVDMRGSMALPDRTLSNTVPKQSSSRRSKTTANLNAIRGLLANEEAGEDEDAFLDQINKLDLEAFYHHDDFAPSEQRPPMMSNHQHCDGYGYEQQHMNQRHHPRSMPQPWNGGATVEI